MPLNLVFKALADPTRRRILDLLREGDLTAGEIAAHFRITKPSISHHLALLKQAGLVEDRRQGQNIVYALNATVFQEVVGWTMSFLHVGERGDGEQPEDPHAAVGEDARDLRPGVGRRGSRSGRMPATVDQKGASAVLVRAKDGAGNGVEGGRTDEGSG